MEKQRYWNCRPRTNSRTAIAGTKFRSRQTRNREPTMRLFRNSICRRGNTLVAILILVSCATAFADDERTMLAPYVNGDTFAVLRLDVDAIPMPTNSEEHIDKVIKLPGE